MRDKCTPKNKDEIMHLTELFDFFAGTETGAYIATNLVLPSASDAKKPTQSSAKAVEFFE